MAITWAVEIEVTKLISSQEAECNITGTRTDDADPDNPKVYKVQGLYDTVNNTPAQLLATYGDLLWAEYQADATEQAEIDALVSTAETALATNLQNREP
jgi:hypothetical protein